MMKRFVDGLIFGAGFATAFAVVWFIWGIVSVNLLPYAMNSAVMRTKEPRFENPKEADIVKRDPSVAADKSGKEFRFFTGSEDYMKIPSGGGILAMAVVNTKTGSKKPSTYQLWLTESTLWQIRTTEDKVEVEQLPLPKNLNGQELDRIMTEKVGFSGNQSSMTVSSREIQQLKSGAEPARGSGLNGKLGITAEGVVFVSPNPYGT